MVRSRSISATRRVHEAARVTTLAALWSTLKSTRAQRRGLAVLTHAANSTLAPGRMAARSRVLSVV